ncbi:hypothetical protein C655_06575, partial [Enterococcus hirae 57-09-G6]
LIAEGQLFEHRESEVVKTSGSSDDNKKEFFETAPHVLENHRLLLRSCFLNAVYSFLEILEETVTIFVSFAIQFSH